MFLHHVCNQYLHHVTSSGICQAFCPRILCHDPLPSRFVLQNAFDHLSGQGGWGKTGTVSHIYSTGPTGHQAPEFGGLSLA